MLRLPSPTVEVRRVATQDLDFAPYAQILRALLPRARGIYLYVADGDLAWSSEGADYFDLRPVVEQLLDAARDPAHLDLRGRLAMIDELPAWCFLLRDELGGVLAVLAILGRVPGRTDDLPAFDAVERTLAPLLALARRELASRKLIAETSRFNLADTQELQWLLDVTHLEPPRGSGADPLQPLLEAFAERDECDVVLLHVPGRCLERAATRSPLATAELELLRGLVGRHLYRIAQLQQKTLIVNKVRETAAGGLVPYRILCVPIAKRGQVIGVAVAFNRAAGRPFETRDARMLERLAPRLREIVDVQFDEATGLLTRHALEERAAALFAREPGRPRALVYCEVDQLHLVNDLFGFAAGDALVAAVAETWRSRELPPGSLTARLDGDRFVALLEDASANRARAWALEARDAIAGLPAPERCAVHRVSASFGVAMLDPARPLEHALAAARSACKAAKDRGRNRVEVFSDTDASLVQRHDELRIYRDLVDAFQNRRFRLYVQPIVPLWDPSRAPRYEVLVRLLDAREQPVAPERFLAAANRYQRLGQLDDWVLEELTEQLGRAHVRLAGTSATFAVNVSAQALGSPEYLERARARLAQAQLPPGTLGFEIAESIAIGRLPEAERFVAGARELGCSVTLDDFGSGASSLAHLKSLPVSALKIDARYVRDLLTHARSESMVRAILDIARQLELETVAECVETPECASHLATLGVTFGQGYALAAPRPLGELLDELTRKSAPKLTEAVARISRPAADPGDDRTPVH